MSPFLRQCRLSVLTPWWALYILMTLKSHTSYIEIVVRSCNKSNSSIKYVTRSFSFKAFDNMSQALLAGKVEFLLATFRRT